MPSRFINQFNKPLTKFLWAVPFLLLPLWPLGASVLLIAFGLFNLKHLVRHPFICLGVAFFTLLTCLSQVLAPPLPKDIAPPWPGENASINYIPPYHLAWLAGFNIEEGQVLNLIQRHGDFWRMPRINPATGRNFTEFYLTTSFPVLTGNIYTQSVFFKHDGSHINFQLSFFTHQGHHVEPTTFVYLGGGVGRAYATYKARDSDEYVRGLNITNLQGDWNYLSFAYPQLELSPTPSAYTINAPERPSLYYRLTWLIGMSLFGLLSFSGGIFLWQRAWTIVPLIITTGLAITFIFVIFEQITSPYELGYRATGFTSHPNFLSHSAVVCAGLTLLGKRYRITILGFCLALGIVWFSGSRMALLALIFLFFYWSYRRQRSWQSFFFALLFPIMFFGLWIANEGNLGRFATLFNPDDVSSLSRLSIWGIAQQIMKQYPWQGGGLESFSYFHNILATETVTSPLAAHTHNLFFQLLTETGIIGLIGFTGLLAALFYSLWCRRAWINILLILTVLFLNFTDFTLFNESIYYAFWLIVASGASLNPSKDDEGKKLIKT